jgi:hypothetical protein
LIKLFCGGAHLQAAQKREEECILRLESKMKDNLKADIQRLEGTVLKAMQSLISVDALVDEIKRLKSEVGDSACNHSEVAV